MNIKKTSGFKDPSQDTQWLAKWVKELEWANNKSYDFIQVDTSLGKTQVWGLNTEEENLETLVVFPGARTTALFWDFDNGLLNLGVNLKIYMVETNGLPNLSDGNTPDIKSDGYGEWASEVLKALGVDQAYVAGASFGGLVCMKLCLVAPELVKAAFLLNPGCLQPFSLSLKNLYFNLLPIVSPNEKNVRKFLEAAVFCKPTHQLSAQAEKLIVDYEVFALTRYNDNTQKPYNMDTELAKVNTPTYLILGDHDLLFPFEKSIRNAKKHIKTLKEIKVFKNVAHGIETYAEAMVYIGEKITEDKR